LEFSAEQIVATHDLCAQEIDIEMAAELAPGQKWENDMLVAPSSEAAPAEKWECSCMSRESELSTLLLVEREPRVD
jgi:hypothetical protein